MRRALLLLTTMSLAVLLASGVALAIINGQPDDNAHPYVGMVYNAEGDESHCSGTLISPTVFLTAAHCTKHFDEADLQVYVTFEDQADFLLDEAYTGTLYTHPNYDGFFPDVGVVVLDEAVSTGASYGRVPEAGIVERFKTGKPLTVVGYGANDFEVGGGPPEPVYLLTRYMATVEYLGTEGPDNSRGVDRFIKTSAASAGEGGEGVCFGDSGAPFLLPRDERTVVAVTSFGPSPRCAAVAYGQRVDLPVVLGWVRSFL
jgi:secreted trypsin-like serine protease